MIRTTEKPIQQHLNPKQQANRAYCKTTAKNRVSFHAYTPTRRKAKRRQQNHRLAKAVDDVFHLKITVVVVQGMGVRGLNIQLGRQRLDGRSVGHHSSKQSTTLPLVPPNSSAFDTAMQDAVGRSAYTRLYKRPTHPPTHPIHSLKSLSFKAIDTMIMVIIIIARTNATERREIVPKTKKSGSAEKLAGNCCPENRQNVH